VSGRDIDKQLQLLLSACLRKLFDDTISSRRRIDGALVICGRRQTQWFARSKSRCQKNVAEAQLSAPVEVNGP
jgi:hypothetical protein